MDRKAARPKIPLNTYEQFDLLTCAGSPFDEQQTSDAIKSLMVEQKRSVNKRSFPDLLPIDEPAFDPYDASAVVDEDPVANQKPGKLNSLLGNGGKAAARLAGRWWFLPVIFFIIFPEILLSALILGAVLILLSLALLGPEALLDSLSPAWRKRGTVRDAAIQWFESVKDKLVSVSRRLQQK